MRKRLNHTALIKICINIIVYIYIYTPSNAYVSEWASTYMATSTRVTYA